MIRDLPTNTLFTVIAVLGLAGALVSGAVTSGALAQGPGDRPPPAVVIETVENRPVSIVESFIGRVEPIEDIDIVARVEGFLTARHFTEGEVVEKGAPLFEIERTQYEADLAEAEARLYEAERRYERNRELREGFTVTQAALDQAKADMETAAAQVKRAKLNLDYTTIEAPITGRVGAAQHSVGDLVGPGSGLLVRLVQIDPIHAVFPVSETIIIDLKQSVADYDDETLAGKFKPTLALPGGEDYGPAGTIDFLDNAIDPATGTINVWAEFPNEQQLLIPGSFVTVKIRRDETEKQPVIPQKALGQDREGAYVMIVNPENTALKRRVRVGEQLDESRIVIRDGLMGGENIIVEGLQNIQPNSPVNPRREGESEGEGEGDSNGKTDDADGSPAGSP